MTIYLLRHGQSEGNLASLFSGATDHPLTELGRQQARDAGNRFQGARFSHLFTSRLSRAIETADIFLVSSGVLVGKREARAELNERHFGIMEGKDQPQGDWVIGDVPWRVCNDVDFAPEGGESMRDTHRRAIAFMDNVAAELDSDVLIVAHGNVLRSMTLHALGWPVDMLPEMPSRNCLVTRLCYGRGAVVQPPRLR